MIPIIDRDGISQEIPERHMMPAVEFEFSAFEGLDDLLQRIGVLVGLFFFFGHGGFSFLENKKAPEDYSQGADLLCCGCSMNYRLMTGCSAGGMVDSTKGYSGTLFSWFSFRMRFRTFSVSFRTFKHAA